MQTLFRSIRWLMTGVFVLSLIYVTRAMLSPFVPSELIISDKLVHFLVFGWLALTLDWSGLSLLIAKITKLRTETWMIIALAIYGGLLEIGQFIVPGRSMSLLDWLADLAGIVVYFWGMYLLRVLTGKPLVITRPVRK